MAPTNDALRTILPVAGWSEDRARTVEISRDTDPILPTPFRIGETSAAALGAVVLAASDLCELRAGRRQEIAVDTRQATASLRSTHYMQIDGAPVSTERNAVMGTYPAKDGRWSYLHCNFPNHRAAALSVLGVPEDREAVRQAVAKWDALALEEDRKSTRLNSSHLVISYAVFCLKKKTSGVVSSSRRRPHRTACAQS